MREPLKSVFVGFTAAMEGDNKRRRPQNMGRRAVDHHGRARRSGSAAEPRESDKISDEYGGGGCWAEQSLGAPDGAEYYNGSELPEDFSAHSAFEREQAGAHPAGSLEGDASLIADGPDAGEAEPASLHTGPESEHMAAGGAAAEAAGTRPPILLADRHSRRRRRTRNRDSSDEPSILELLGPAGDDLDDVLEGVLPSGEELAELEFRANDPDSALRGDADSADDASGDDGPEVLAAAPSPSQAAPGSLPEAASAGASAAAPGPGGAAATGSAPRIRIPF